MEVGQDNPLLSSIVLYGPMVIIKQNPPRATSPHHLSASYQTKTETFAHMLDLFYNISRPGAPFWFFMKSVFNERFLSIFYIFKGTCDVDIMFSYFSVF